MISERNSIKGLARIFYSKLERAARCWSAAASKTSRSELEASRGCVIAAAGPADTAALREIRRLGPMRQLTPTLFLLSLLFAVNAYSNTEPNLFDSGLKAYRAGDFDLAAEAFQNLAAARPSSGALQNLGNAEWARGRVGEAVLAWEQALWLNPFDRNSRNNLQFARETAQLETPELNWHEVASSWLPSDWWAWLAGISLWSAVGALVLPGVLCWRRAAWHQAVAALGLGVFLVCIPAHVGTLTRSKIGVVLQKETPLRLTPTAEAEYVGRLAAGEPARRVRVRGKYVFVRTRFAAGWILEEQLGMIGGG